jgi:tRNA G18 (ribose-2'-O)-methylase SpoU
MVIASKDNQHFKEFKKLTVVDGVRKYGKAIVSGRKLIKEIAQSPVSRCMALILYERYADDDSVLKTIIKQFADAGSLHILKKNLYNELDTLNTNAPLLVIRVPDIPEWDYSPAEGCILLIPFQDPLNAGAVIRSAAGFGVQKIIMLKEAAHPFHPRSIKSSAGAVFKANLFSGPSIYELKAVCDKHKLNIITLDMSGTPIESFQFPESFLLLPGLEGQGVPEELKASAISIPISSSIESLNAAIAVSVVLYSWDSRSSK